MTWNNPATAGPPYRWRWAAFAVVLLASVMDLLDSLVTNIAGPTIRADIGGGPALIQWLGAGYTLAMAAGLITGGRLGDIYGRKPVFIVGVIGFTVASVLCASSFSPGMLIGCRVAQGLFGAVMLPQGLGVIKAVFPPQELAKAFGAYGPAMGFSTVLGPVIAGTLIDANLFGSSWRMIFLINLPLGLVALVGAIKYLPSDRDERAPIKLDLLGTVLASSAALLVVYPVVQGRSLGWPAWTFVMIAASVVVFGIFGWVETRIHNRGGDPLVVPTLFRKRAFTGGLFTGLAFFTAIVGFSLVFTVFVQIGLGYSPLKAGLTTLPQAVGSVVGFIAAGAGLAAKLGRRMLHLGLVSMTAGVIGTFLTIHYAGTGLTPYDLIPSLLFTGIGLGMFLAPFFDIVLAGVEAGEYGSASGTLNAVQQFAGALGIAVVGTVFFGVLGGHVASAVDSHAPALRTQLSVAGVSSADQDTILANLHTCEQDRATASDPAAVPASCAVLNTAVGKASAEHGPEVGQAVGTTAVKAAKAGFSSAVQETIWTVVGLLAAAFVLGFALPMKAAQQGDWANQDWGGQDDGDGGAGWGGQGGGDGADGENAGAGAGTGTGTGADGKAVPGQSANEWQQYSGTQNTAD
ncbi:major facilitator superfamily MFS_1 [Catenulispora acidiphila DSM 44928]|uniref:Major facilitator superfamily MFS_1 n=1 Tax=Catenulispora acidiphila (strain DSM 44928 / JCM 14897 / NBRC 102108 / NRRL B-24433 / ID139908) TaxID=479433 RepID=C7PY57_CATAD|nr:MFS transporter [Catenulispora acidiphila]ACU75347.1 major facilitator superfamily MFS_1 [Catenulispora acidiphila DSM 44928]